jgi:hypothetical protein
MTNDEQLLAQARIMNQFKEAEKRLIVLKYQAEEIGAKLIEIGQALCGNLVINEADYSYLDPSRIRSLIEDYKSTSEKVARLKGHLIAIGWIENTP